MSIPQTSGTTNQMPLLVHEGPQQISASLQLASAELSQKVELLEKDVATASKKLAKKTAALEKFKKSRVLYEKNIQNALYTSETAIKKYYERRVTQKIDERKEALITITMDKMPTPLALPFINKYERSKEYSAEVGKVFKSVLEEIRQEILKEFTALPGFVAYKDAYEENRNKLLQEAEAFNELKGLASIKPQFPASFVNSVHGMLIPEAKELICGEPVVFWNFILAFGLFLPFINSRARATAIVDKYLDNSKKMTFNQLWNCMYQENPEGPMKALRNSLSDFKRCFNKAEEIVQKNLDGAKGLQKDAKHTSDEISSHTMSIPQTTGTANKVRLFIADETKKELRSLSKEYADMCSQHRNQRNDVVTKAIEDHLVDTLSHPFVNKVKRANEFERALSTLPIFDIGAFKAKLCSYYKERKDTLQRLYQKEGISGEFPDIPFYFATYGMNTPLSRRDETQLFKILTWGRSYFWSNTRDRAKGTRTQFFPELEATCAVPGIFAETLCEQTVQLWGASPDKVYQARCELLIDRVLPAAFEWLKQWLPTSSDSSYLEHEYRELTRAICEELDNLAKRLTHCTPMDAYKTRFSDEEYQKQVTEKTQKGKERATAVLDVLELELAYIQLHYKVVIQ